MDVPSLRPATREDAEFIFEVKKATLDPYAPKTWGLDEGPQRRLFIEAFDPDRIQIILFDEQPIGYIITTQGEDHIELEAIDLLPRFQNHGIGSYLILQLIESAAQQHLRVTLQVSKANPARHLYERLGFVTIEEAESYYIMAATG